MKPFDIMVPVWGKRYCDYLVDCFLPSLMSPRNLPLLKAEDGHRLLVATTVEDWNYLCRVPIFNLISRHIWPTRVPFTPNMYFKPGNNFDAYSVVISDQSRAQIALHEAQQGLGCMVCPDFIFSDGMIECLLKRVAEGYKVVLIPGQRQAQEDVFADPEFRPQMQPRELARLCVRHMHPELKPYMVEDHLPEHPPFVLYKLFGGFLINTFHAVTMASEAPHRYDRLVNDGIVINTMSAHTYAEDPPKDHLACLQKGAWECVYFGTNYKPEEAYIVSDSDECWLLSLGPKAVDWSTPVTRRRRGFIGQLIDIRRSVKIYCEGMPLKEKLFRTPLFLHGSDITDEWRQKERAIRLKHHLALDIKWLGMLLDGIWLVRNLAAHAKGWACQRYTRWRRSSLRRFDLTRTR